MPRSELVGAGVVTSSSGITVYRGDAYPAEFRGNLFVADVAGNLFYRLVTEADGVTFKAKRVDGDREFCAGKDVWFRPVNFTNAPDGCLHVCDMYREVIEHPWSLPDDIHAALDLQRGRDAGRLYRLAPPGFKARTTPKLSRATTAKLVALLAHPNAWHRDTAHRLLFERQDQSAVPVLREMLSKHAEARARLHALWSLVGLAALAAEDLGAALLDHDEHVRVAAVQLAEISPAVRATLQRSTAAARAAPLFTATGSRHEVLARYQPALTLKGDAAKGRVIFTTACAACHRKGDAGRDIGPNLATIAAWSAEQLLTNILDPNREVSPNFMLYTAELKDGRGLAGIITAETESGLVLKGIDGTEQSLARNDLATLKATGTSPMPEGLEATVSIEQMADLITFLREAP